MLLREILYCNLEVGAPLLIFAEIGEGVTGISSEREEEGESLSVAIVI
jgi:hypothetical protein